MTVAGPDGPKGVLIVVGTPIGNLEDLSPRAVTTLAGVGTIACEDTRRTGRLLARAGISGPRLLAVHEHNELEQAAVVLRRLAAGESVALVSDAGMPAVSDPGERLVRAAVDAGVEVRVVPGPSAALAGLVLSGLPAARFCFEGFLPRKGAERAARLAALADEPRTTVLFEAPHRLARTLADLAGALGGARRVALARELTKLHEEVWRGTLAGAGEHAAAVEPRGEYVVVLEGAPPPAERTDGDIAAALTAQRAAGATTRDAVAAVAGALGVSRNRVYDIATTQRSGDGADG